MLLYLTVAGPTDTVLLVLVFLVPVHIEIVTEILQMVAKLTLIPIQIIAEVAAMFVREEYVQTVAVWREIVMLLVVIKGILRVVVEARVIVLKYVWLEVTKSMWLISMIKENALRPLFLSKVVIAVNQ
jgi:hypothetical protein